MSPTSTIRCLAAGLVSLAACGPAPAAAPVPVVSPAEVREIVGALAADSMEGRRTGTPGSVRAARFLAERMRSYGLQPAGDSGYFQRVPYEVASGPGGEPLLRLPGAVGSDSSGVERVTDYNLIGLIRGADSTMRDEVVVIGAHFDHLGIGKPIEGDSIYNGADDDASGVATVLVAARALAQAPPRRSVIVLLTSGEEFGVLGTQWYADHPAAPLASTVAGLQVEMVGRPDSLAGGPGRLWLTGYGRSTMGEAFSTAGLPVVPDPRPSFRFFERSDNIVFALRGIPAHTLSSFGMHADYHLPSDEVDRIDLAHLELAADNVARAARLLADGPAPTWRIGGRPTPTSP